MFRRIFFLTIIFTSSFSSRSAQLLIPMDETQTDHLKAYGITFLALQGGVVVDWLLNYRGGSFGMIYTETIEKECKIRKVKYEVTTDGQYSQILTSIADPEVNMDLVKLEKAPKICVYSPKSALPWDDAVTLVLTYAEIPYEIIYDEEVITGKLPTYDWLHLHHEDFTGQFGKFYGAYRNADWYIQQVLEDETMAQTLGYSKVSLMKLDVAKKIREYVAGGGYMFAMCSATDSYDIALAADGIDICAEMFDGDPADASAQSKLDFSQCFAFENFTLKTNPYEYEFSNIDVPTNRKEDLDYFTLFEFSAKWDQVPTMLTQCHERTVKGFMGQTTAFRNEIMKTSVTILGDNKAFNECRYIHGEYGFGTWTWYGGHDPEDYQHFIGDPKTDLSLHPNSAGYRLILNNVLFPAAEKKERKT